ncbi:MAG: tetratricopeptide repeat protein, partial [Rhodospirillaceae bacterium]|nr:tetratricopeptide repeat protein [Rhodospirillaceae bacterium]
MPKLSPQQVDMELQAAIRAHRNGQWDEAERMYRMILTDMPGHAECWHLLGLVALQTDRAGHAIDLIGTALRLAPENPTYLSNRGEAYRRLGQLNLAKADLQMALQIAPNSAAALNNLGLTLNGLGDKAGARKCFAQAVRLKPGYVEAINNLGLVLRDLGETLEAIQRFRDALIYNPDYAPARTNLGAALEAAGRHGEAEAQYRKNWRESALDREAGMALGNLLAGSGRTEEALEVYVRLSDSWPNDADVVHNLASAKSRLGSYAEARALYRRSIELRPEFAEAHRNFGHLLLQLGEYADGWRHYAWRWKCKEFAHRQRPFEWPTWDGSALRDGTLLIWSEQGLGDEILFLGMATDLMSRGLRLAWEIDARLIPLLARSFPTIRFVPRSTPAAPVLDELEIAAQIPSGQLGTFLRTAPLDFPHRAAGYLSADPEKRAALRARLLAGGPRDRLIVGISWSSKNAPNSRHKSTSLADWRPILSAPGVVFVDLQYGDTLAERAAAGAELVH